MRQTDTIQTMEIEKRLALKAAGDPRSEWSKLALEAAERIEALKRELKKKGLDKREPAQ